MSLQVQVYGRWCKFEPYTSHFFGVLDTRPNSEILQRKNVIYGRIQIGTRQNQVFYKYGEYSPDEIRDTETLP